MRPTRIIVAGALYVGAAAIGIVATNEDQSDVLILWLVIVPASILVAWAIGDQTRLVMVLCWCLPAATVLVALPLGDANTVTGGDSTLPVVMLVAYPAVLSMLIIVIGSVLRRH